MMAASRRKVIHLSSVHRPFDVRIFEKQCRSLAADGWDVVLVAAHDHDEWRDGVLIHAVPRPRSLWQRVTRTSWQVFRTALRYQGDLYQIHDPELLPWARVLKGLGRTVIYDMHENVPKDVRTKTWLPGWLRHPLSAFVALGEHLLLFRLPVIFAETSYARDYAWVKPSVVVLNFPSLERLPEPAASRFPAPTVGYIGGVFSDRGSCLTLEALQYLRDQGMEVGWECVGPILPADHQTVLQQTVDAAGLQRVRFHGYLPPQEGWALIRQCHIGLAVLSRRPNYIGSYPTKLFEYMALALPVITSDFPLYREVVDRHQCGLCIDPESPRALADAIAYLIGHPEEARQMGQRGRLAVSREYCWQREFVKLRDFYEQLL